MSEFPERWQLDADHNASRLLAGLWQVADMEKGGATIDPEQGADALAAYAAAGFDTFDMADHYGSAELIAGRLLGHFRERRPLEQRPLAFTKWCPPPGPMAMDIVRAGVEQRLARLGIDRVDLLQFHWWSFSHPAWLDALHRLSDLRDEGLINAIGLTNFDAAHLQLALADGVPIATNQVSFSLLDRRAAGPLSTLCRATGVRLLAYGTLCGGFLSEKWLGRPAPESVSDWSRSKYRRFIDAAGGWDAFQSVLGAAGAIARKHDVSIANVATRWVLDHETVGGVIIGARLGESEHRADNLRVFDFALDDEDRAWLGAAFAKTQPIPGDCGDEYRRPPFLTATGDLSQHLSTIPSVYRSEPVPGFADRLRISSGTVWEGIAGYSRAVRIGNTIRVSGTTATDSSGRPVAPTDPAAQTTYILDKIEAAIMALGGQLSEVVRTRVYLRDVTHWEPVSRVHGRVFGNVRPANTLLEVGHLVGDYLVEIEAEAVTSPSSGDS